MSMSRRRFAWTTDRYAPSLLDPGRCPKCGITLSAFWGFVGSDKSHRAAEAWESMCVGCELLMDDGGVIKLREFTLEKSNVMVAVGVDGEGGLTVFQRAAILPEPGYGTETLAGALASRITYMAGLHEARELEKTKPGKWRLELRDGVMWAPWSIRCRRKTGSPWPFRRAKLRALGDRRRRRLSNSRGGGVVTYGEPSKPADHRTCACCSASVTAGDEVYRPDMKHWDRVDWRERQGWTKSLLSGLLVCLECAGKAEARRPPTRLVTIQGEGQAGDERPAVRLVLVTRD